MDTPQCFYQDCFVMLNIIALWLPSIKLKPQHQTLQPQGLYNRRAVVPMVKR
jgi:hypothetical protein